MEEIMKKIEAYNIVNYLIPGIIFTIVFTYLTGKAIPYNGFGIAVVEYYFIGLVISRIGSVIINPILKLCRIITEEKYEKFKRKEKEDEKLHLLVREANQYRTFIATFVVLLIIEVNNIINKNYEKWTTLIFFVGFIFLFIISYRKQVSYIRKRIIND